MGDIIEMPTKYGEPLQLAAIDDDILTPTSSSYNMKAKLPLIRDATYKDGDVLLCSYPKSGTHWVAGIIHKMLEIQMSENEKEMYRENSTGILELTPIEVFQNALPPRLIPNHLRPKRIPSYFLEGKGKVVLVLRNPKDVAVSFFYHLRDASVLTNKQDWSEFFESFRNGLVPFRSCFDYMKAWEAEITSNKKLNIEVVYYEDLQTKGLECMRSLSKHLALDLHDEALKAILDACSLTNLKQEEEATKPAEKQKAFLNKDGQSVIFRKGKVADWKNHFTVAQNEVFDQQIKEALKDSMFHFRYE